MLLRLGFFFFFFPRTRWYTHVHKNVFKNVVYLGCFIAVFNGHIELTLLKGHQRFDAISTLNLEVGASNLEVYKFQE